MVDGVIGVSGKLVQLAVEEDTKTERDYVIVHRHNLKVKTVPLMDHLDTRLRNAMKIRVQVNTNLALNKYLIFVSSDQYCILDDI